MCKNKRLLALLLAGAMALSLAGCGGGSGDSTGTTTAAAGGDTAATTAAAGGSSDETTAAAAENAEPSVYRTLYSSEVTTLNYLTSGSTNDWSIGANVVDNLIEYDKYGKLLPSLAESWESNDDLTEWTFHIRQGVKWVDKDGNEVADVTANDWVSTAKYMNDARNDSDNRYMYSTGAIVTNAQEYYDYTAYLLSCETYGFEEGDENAVDDEGNAIEVVEPVDPDSIGVKAVDDYTLVISLDQPCPFFLSVLSYTAFMPVYGPFLEQVGDQFGLDADNLLYCGAYILSSFEPQQEHVLTKNPTYWDKDNVFIDEIRSTYNAEASSISLQMYLDGEVDGASIDTNLLDSMLQDDTTKNLIHTTRRDLTYSYWYMFNFDPHFDEVYEPENWKIAVNNVNFRKALTAGLDRVRALTVTDPYNPENLLNNTVTPAEFTVGDGVDFTQYPALKPYSDGDSFDEAAAVAYRDKAREELEAAGCTFPVKVLMPYNPTVTNWDHECQIVEQQMEGLLGEDFIDIIVEAGPETGFLGEVRRSGKYAFMKCNWGADYSDPLTYTEPFGIDNSYNFWDKCEDETTHALFTQWYEMVYGTEAAIKNGLRDESIPESDWVTGASQIYEDNTARYTAFAEAEALLLENAIVAPITIDGYDYTISNLNPLEGEYAPYGVSLQRYKYQHLYDTSMNMEEFNTAYAQWETERAGALTE